MCICYDEDDIDCTPTSNTYIDLLISVAPRLKMLVFSQWYRNPRDMGECYFSEFSQSIRFTRLKELHLHWIQIRFESFKSFLNTTKGTLDSLSLELVSLKPNIPPSTDYEPTCWRHVWEFLGAELSLNRLYMGHIGCWGRKVMIQGPGELVEPTYSATFNADVTDICFNDWIGQLKPILSKSQDLSARNYPGLQLTKPPKLRNFFLIPFVKLASWEETSIKRRTSFRPSNTRETPPTPRTGTRGRWAPNNLPVTREILTYVSYSHKTPRSLHQAFSYGWD